MSVQKSWRELQTMARACRIVVDALDALEAAAVPGTTTKEMDRIARERIEKAGARPAFLGYRGYPATLCISVNEEVVHGLAGSRRLGFGDIVSLDVGVLYRGFIGDNACTVPAGGCSPLAQKLIDITERALYEGIAQALPGHRVADVSAAIQRFVEGHGFNVVREFVGHGVGRSMHEEPQVPNYVDGKSSPRLRPGMTIAIEPMVNAGTAAVRVLPDGWTVVSQDGLPSAHFEQTVLITEGEPEILTCRERMPVLQAA